MPFQPAIGRFFADNCAQTAAAISYYVLFSLFPLVIFLVAVLGLFLRHNGLQEKTVDAVLDYIPLNEDRGRNEVGEAVRNIGGAGSAGLGAFGLVVMMWSGSTMFGVIRRSIEVVFGVHRKQPFVKQKLLDFAMAGGFVLMLLISVAATTALRIVSAHRQDAPYVGPVAERSGLLWDVASFATPVGLSFIAFLMLYWLLPGDAVRIRDVWRGAVVASVLFEGAKVGFTIYLENFSRYDLVFGALGAAASFLFWIYLSAIVLLFGAELAATRVRSRVA